MQSSRVDHVQKMYIRTISVVTLANARTIFETRTGNSQRLPKAWQSIHFAGIKPNINYFMIFKLSLDGGLLLNRVASSQ